jgi:cytochrome c biogenesis protein CcdA/thiol-disulfide isomerase/thioredoxin
VLTLLLIGVLAGAITAVSPCVLPVLPVIFFGAGSATGPGLGHPVGTAAGSTNDGAPPRVRRGGAGLIVLGLVLSFALLTLAGSVLVAALHLPTGVLRWAGLIVVFFAGFGQVVPAVQRVLQYPFARVPLPKPSRAYGPLVLGLAVGALYVPCAGPVIAAIAIAGSTGAVDQGVLVLTAAFSVGTALPFLLFSYAGQHVAGRTPWVRSRSRLFRVTGGVVMMTLAVALTFNLTDGLQRWTSTYTAAVQDAVEGSDRAQQELQQLTPPKPAVAPVDSAAEVQAPNLSGPVTTCRSAAEALANCGPAPELVGIETWINTEEGTPVTLSALRGHVVLVDFWTFACVNCQRVLPYVTAWYDTYHDAGLDVIGVHTPEFTFERDPENVRSAVAEQSIRYPVGTDNSSATWRNYRNGYWPAAYLIDSAGTLRYVKFGEGDYQHTEALIRQLLVAADPTTALPPPVNQRR